MGGILHIVPGTDDVANGMVVVARLLAKEQGDAEVVDLKDADCGKVASADEVWVHGMWLPREWAACRMALRAGKRLVRMTHGSLSPIYLTQQSPLKKKLLSPIERYFLRRANKVVATCEAERGWIEAYENRVKKVEVTDLKRFFNLEPEGVPNMREAGMPLHILYLGRRHPLKGLDFRIEALSQLQEKLEYEFRVVGKAFGEKKVQVWDWCDVLILPTLSENFGLVIAEALERGKRVITTDGAPAWGDGLSRVERVEGLTQRRRDAECAEMFSRVEHVERVEGGLWSGYGGRLIYLKGYRDGTDEERVELLRRAIELMSVGEMMAVS